MPHSTPTAGEPGAGAPRPRLASPLLLRSALLAGFVLLPAGALWLLARQPSTPYLPALGPAEWIIYPESPQPSAIPVAEQSTIFRREFGVETPPQQARLELRAYREVAVTVNGRAVPLPDTPGPDWKQAIVCDIAPYLRPGKNLLSCTVRNDAGPPALWLSLAIDSVPLLSDSSWESSMLDATWLPARPANAAGELRAGNPVAGGERTAAGLRSRWGLLLGFAVLSALILAGGWYALQRRANAPAWVSGGRLWAAGIALGWVGLLAYNWQSLPFPIGYDADLHLQYVRYVQDRWALPLANEGVEMHQPPLYYVLAAAVLKVFGVAADGSESCVFLLRAVGLLTGLAGVFLAALCLRRLFPGRAVPQAAGVAVAAALPPYLYLAHYLSNDLLAGVLGTAAVYLTLVTLQADRPKAGLLVALGATLGAAVLTKLTAAPMAAVVLGTLAVTAAVRDRSARAVARLAGVPLLVCLLVCGWFFYRNYQHFGRPVVGYNHASEFVWWQYPGYADATQFLRFGRGLTDPFYAAQAGVPDGLYSTLWGDGGFGGAMVNGRPPWNYELMAAGYALALLPTALALLGGAAAAVAWVRRPTAEWGLLLALPVAAGAALAGHYLSYPFVCHIKAFYLLPAAVSLFAFAGSGFDLLTRRWAWARGGLGVLLGTWALAAFAAFLVRPSSAETLVWVGARRLNQGETAAGILCTLKALEVDRASPGARNLLGGFAIRDNRPADAVEEFRRSASASPTPEGCIGLADALARMGRTAEGIRQAEDAIRRYPDSVEAHVLLASLRDFEGNAEGTVGAAREGLRVSPIEPRLHVLLARGLLRSNETAEAVRHYRIALTSEPNSVAALSGLAWVCATHEEGAFRNGAEAVALAQRACKLTDNAHPQSLRALAAAYAETEDFTNAERVAEQALDTLTRSSDVRITDRLKRDIRLYRAGKPLREKPGPGPD